MTTSAAPLKSPPGLLVTRILAWGYAIIAAVSTLVSLIDNLFGGAPTVSTPVETFFPGVNSSLKLDGLTAKLSGGGYDHATFQLAGLHWDARALLAGGHLLQGVTAIVVALTVVTLCSRVSAGVPFAPAVERAITRSGVAILIGGILWQILLQAGGYIALNQAFAATGWSSTIGVKGITPQSSSWPHPGSFTVDFWPIGIAIALFAVAAVFRFGARLERDRARLQVDRDRLERDTAGLV